MPLGRKICSILTTQVCQKLRLNVLASTSLHPVSSYLFVHVSFVLKKIFCVHGGACHLHFFSWVSFMPVFSSGKKLKTFFLELNSYWSTEFPATGAALLQKNFILAEVLTTTTIASNQNPTPLPIPQDTTNSWRKTTQDVFTF